ncbi:MAG TPA: flagellar hook protein FlgE [Longimicrobiaceae bacterium]
MMRSLFAGVSGLRNHQVRMDVIGNNVANVNTVAFKSSRVTFKEGFAQLLQGASRPPGDHGGINPIQVGLGMQVGSIDQMFTQGNIETTGQSTDLAIQGDALFVVAKGNEHYYTRSGNFQLDADGRLVSPTNGFVVQGRMAVNGVLQEGITDIKLPFGQKVAAEPTSQVTLAGNVNSAAPVYAGPFVPVAVTPPVTNAAAFNTAYSGFATATMNPGATSGYYGFSQDAGTGVIELYKNGVATGITRTGAASSTLNFGEVSVALGAGWTAAAGFPAAHDPAADVSHASTANVTDPANARAYTTTSISVYDSLGTKHDLKIFMYKADADTWNWQVDTTGLEGVPATGPGSLAVNGSTSFNFRPDGTLDTSGFVIPTITFTPAGANEVEITMDPGSGINGMTHFQNSSTAVLRDQNGYTMGQLQNFSIDRTGMITGAFTNGTSVPLGQIVLADFNNPSGLLRTGDNMYSVSSNSGGAVLGFPLEGSQSFLTSGALEMSNVDLAQEFTNMIVSQRGFQANGRVITNSDQMLEEVVNLKR